MEQYVHLLIRSDRYFAPEPARIAAFFDVLAGSWNYQIVWDDQYAPGVRIVWPTDQPRLETDPESGKQFTMMPRFEQVGVSRTADIAAAFEKNPRAMDGRLGCVIAAQGSWRAGGLPIKTPRSLWPAREQEYACSLGLRLHPEPVCTSDWWGEDGVTPVNRDSASLPRQFHQLAGSPAQSRGARLNCPMPEALVSGSSSVLLIGSCRICRMISICLIPHWSAPPEIISG